MYSDDFWIAVLVIVALAIPLALIFLLVRVDGLRRRIEALERAAARAAQVAAAPVAARPLPEKGMTAAEPAAKPAAPEPPPIPKSAAKPAAWPGAMMQSAGVQPPLPPAPPPGPSASERLASWLSGNWFYVVSAASLALAGLFMVQYGIENGLIPPVVRVLAALGFGAALIGGGEYLRRRYGDDAAATTAYLPSVFSAAGIVSLFGGILSARLLYGLIGPELALVGLAGTALLAMVLGWFNGPLLAAVGVVGGFLAPMIVGGTSEDPTWLYLYFAAVTVLGLGIDTLRRWAWVSVLALVMGFGMGWLLGSEAHQTTGALALYVFALAMFAVLIPCRALSPDHQGGRFFSPNWGSAGPFFPTLLAIGGLGAASITLVLLSGDGADTFWLCVILLSVLGIAWILWSENAPALQDQALLPLGGLLAVVFYEGARFGPVARPLTDLSIDPALAPAGPAYPFAVTVLVAIGGLWSLAAAWRSWKGGELSAIWAGAAALIAPALAILIDLFWAPTEVMSTYAWALHAAAIAAGMVFLAERFARLDGPSDRLRVALFTLSGLSAITFACVIVLSMSALTLAIAVAVAAAAWLDRRFDLAPMALFIGVGVLALAFRLLGDPGLKWAIEAPMVEMFVTYSGCFAAMVLGLSLVRPRGRITSIAILDSAGWAFGGLLLSLLLYRVIDGALGGDNAGSHWAMGLFATIWIGMALAQLNVAGRSGNLVWLRRGLAVVFGVFAALPLTSAVTLSSPLLGLFGPDVRGPFLFNTLAPAYLLPAAILALGAWKVAGVPRGLRLFLGGLSVGLVGYWLFGVIRHFWQGAAGMPLWKGFGQGEVSTYTVAVLIIGAALFYQSLARADRVLRRAGLVVIGIAVAKVFLIDIGSLGGLIRVFSFLLLGFALAGLAWLNNWAQKNEKQRAEARPPTP